MNIDKDKLPAQVKKEVDKYMNEGKDIQREIVEIFNRRSVSPFVAHSILKDMMKVIEKHDPAIKAANEITEALIKQLIEGKEGDKDEPI